jgi:hypothetical protein
MSITDGTQVLGTGSTAPIWITGSINVSNFSATQSVNIVGPISSSVSGSSVVVKQISSLTAVVTSIPASVTSVIIVSASMNRNEVMIYNNSNKNLYVRFGLTAATSTNFTAKLTSNSYYEVPGWYNGQITGIWDANATGAAQVTDLSV